MAVSIKGKTKAFLTFGREQRQGDAHKLRRTAFNKLIWLRNALLVSVACRSAINSCSTAHLKSLLNMPVDQAYT